MGSALITAWLPGLAADAALVIAGTRVVGSGAGSVAARLVTGAPERRTGAGETGFSALMQPGS